MEQQITKTTRNVSAIAFSTLLARGMQFVWGILLARLIGAEGYGTWGIIAGMIATAATLPEFGMGLIVLRDVSQRPNEAGRYLSVTLTVQTALSLIAYVALVTLGSLLTNEPIIRALLFVAGLSLIVDTLGNMCYNQLLAFEQMVATSAITVIHIVLVIGFAFVALMAGGGLLGLYVATICAGLFRVGMFWIALLRQHIRPVWPIDPALVRHLFRDGLPIALGGFLGLAYQHIDKILVGALLTQTEAGYLVAAFFIVFGVVEMASTTVLTALFPLMSRFADKQSQAIRAFTDRLAVLTLAITLPIGIGISLLAARLAALLFPGFVGTAPVLEVLIWHAVVMMVANVYQQLMIIQNRQARMIIFRVVGLITNITLNLILLPRIGVQGAGISIFIAEIIIFTLYLIDHRPDRVTFASLVGRSARILIAGVGMAAGILLLRDFNPIVAGAVGAVIYGALIIVLGVLLPDDWAILRRAALAVPVIGPAILRRWLPAVESGA
ncbi:MAG: polysaccharide biosynthesis protein [Anaerolineae bacterium]|nr:polysaccharide biosynthesis protein [Anaerolineae bacterium]